MRWGVRWLVLGVLLILGLQACTAGPPRWTPSPSPASPGPRAASPTPAPSPTPTPAGVVRILAWDPWPGSLLPMQDARVRLTFEAAMDRDAVARSLAVFTQDGPLPFTLHWRDDRRLEVALPRLPADATITLRLTAAAQDVQGRPLARTYRLEYRTPPPLRVVHITPSKKREVDPRTPIVLVFNQPVVDLTQTQGPAEPPFRLEPETPGQGRWVNTSTYVFQPEPYLKPATRYTLTLKADLQAASGARVPEAARTFSFITQPLKVFVDIDFEYPQVSEWKGTLRVGRTPKIWLRLNLPLPLAMVEEALCLTPDDRADACLPLQGEMYYEEDEEGVRYAFTPRQPLDFDRTYRLTVRFPGLAREIVRRFRTVREDVRPVWVYNFHGKKGAVPVREGEPLVPIPLDDVWAGFFVAFDGPLAKEQDWKRFLRVTPEASFRVYTRPQTGEFMVELMKFQGDTVYTFTLEPGLRTPWGSRIEQAWQWQVRTPPAPRVLTLGVWPNYALYPYGETHLTVYAGQVTQGRLQVVPVRKPVAEAWRSRREHQEDFATPLVDVTFDVPVSDDPQALSLPLQTEQGPLPVGLYWVRVSEVNPPKGEQGLFDEVLLAVVNVHLTVKRGIDGLWIWAVDMKTGQPVTGAQVRVYDSLGDVLWTGTTDDQGIARWTWYTEGAGIEGDLVVLGEPGGEGPFGLGSPDWNDGIDPWSFNLEISREMNPVWVADLMPDRLLYKPGDTLHFRLAVRRRGPDGRYHLPPPGLEVTCTLFSFTNDPLARTLLTLSEDGMGYASLAIPSEARPGTYFLRCWVKEYVFPIVSQAVDVAFYRKPAMQLQLTPQVRPGQVRVDLAFRFYSGGAVGDLSFSWEAYARRAFLGLPGYQVGDSWWWEQPSWYLIYLHYFYPETWRPIAQGKGRTDAQGRATLVLPEDALPEIPSVINILVRARGPDGVPVAAQVQVNYAPEPLYIGVRSDPPWPRAGQTARLMFLTVGLDGAVQPNEPLQYTIYRVDLDWVTTGPETEEALATYTPVAQGRVTTNEQGRAEIPWRPKVPGLYGVVVQARGARTRAAFWVMGSGFVWNPGPHVRIDLTVEKARYRPGETARVFIPNPWPEPARAWLTLERYTVHQSRFLTVPPGGMWVSFPVTEEHIPNMYVSVTLVGKDAQGRFAARFGLAEYRVDIESRRLQVTVRPEPQSARPGDQVTLHLQVRDAQGRPVQGIFSISVVDQALWDITRGRLSPLEDVFYKPLGLDVHTGLSIIHALHRKQRPPVWAIRSEMGLGLGGGLETVDAPPGSSLRQDFRDTAFWLPEVRTDDQGQATVTFTLPDNLTTWDVWVRGLTADTRVGEAHAQVLSTLPVLLEPMTPDFFRRGDEARLAVLVRNNTSEPLTAQVTLTAQGLRLADPATQQVEVPAQGQALVTWWAQVRDEARQVDLTFSLKAGPYADQVRPAGAPFPVLEHWVELRLGQQGVLEGDAALELPFTVPADARRGQLQLHLAATPLDALDLSLGALERFPYACNEQLASRLWAQSALLQAWQAAGRGETPEARMLTARILATWKELRRRRLPGGWGWWPTQTQASPMMTAYVLWAAWQAQQVGVLPAQDPDLEAGRAALARLSPKTLRDLPPDVRAFVFFVMDEMGMPLPRGWAEGLTEAVLGPAGLAFRAALLARHGTPDQAQAAWQALKDRVRYEPDGAAMWPAGADIPWFDGVTATAAVVYVLARERPEEAVLPAAVQYLLGQRGPDGFWQHTFATAWSLAALGRYAQALQTQGQAAAARYRALLDGQPWKAGVIEAAQQFTQDLKPGVHRLGLYNLGETPWMYAALVRWSVLPGETPPLNRGMMLERTYEPVDCGLETCPPFVQLRAQAGQVVRVRLRLYVFQPLYYVMVEDALPAGGVALNPRLAHEAALSQATERRDWTWDRGWGWWAFDPPQIYPDRVVWAARYLEPGTYTLTYLLDLRYPGRYQTAGARAWAFYRPTLQAFSPGAVWEIVPGD